MTTKPTINGIRQVGLYAPNPDTLAEFYRAVLGLQIVGQSDLDVDGVRHNLFLKSHSGADHEQLIIYSNPKMRHTDFQVASLADLRIFYQRVVDRDLFIRWTLNHGVSLAFYFADLAGNLIKLYWPTGAACPQPHGHPIDLTQSEAALRQDVADLVAQLIARTMKVTPTLVIGRPTQLSNKLHIYLFGTPQFTYEDKPVTGIVSNKARALLIYLAVTGRPHSRDALAELLWADKAATRRDNLKKALIQLRNHAHIPLCEEGQQTAALEMACCWVDVREFERVPSNTAVNDVNELQRTVELYRGDFLAGFNTSLSYEFEAWALGEQARLKAQMTAVLHRLAAGYTEENELLQAITITRQLLQLEPWQEETHHRLIELLAWSGDRGGALVQFEQCQQILAAELDVEPSAATIELVTKIRSGALDIGSDQPSYAIARPAMKQVSPAPQHNLPAPTTPLIGREQELAELVRLLDNPGVRLITILGAGGMGKTRLALAIAATTRAAYPDGVCFVALAPLSEPATMVSAIAIGVGYTFQNDDRSPKEQLLDHLCEREMLLLLDNAEHLLAGVSLFTEILQSSPNLHLLVTSRERLRLSSETVFALEGLALSESIYEGDDRGIYEKPPAALQLFLQSAQRVRPSFSPTATDWAAMVELCRLVGGMPLGLILAASWIEVLAPVEIVLEINQNLDFLAADLHDLPERHRSLRAIFNTTWQQLAARERDVFRKLSVFRGGFTREAAEAVAGASLAILTALSRKSLIQVQPNRRYEIHELLRQFAWETVTEEGAEIRDAHSAFYCTFLAQRTVDLKGARQQAAIAEIEADGENVRVAWQWTVQRGYVEQLMQTLDSLGLFYLWRSRLYEGEGMCHQAIEQLGMSFPFDQTAPVPSNRLRLTIRTFIWLSTFQRHLRQSQLAQDALQQARQWMAHPTAVELDMRAEQAYFLQEEAEITVVSDRKHAVQLAEQSLSLMRQLNDRWREGQLLDFLSRTLRALGLVTQAKQVAEEEFALSRELGDTRGLANSIHALAQHAKFVGRFEEAEKLFRQSIDLYAEVGDRDRQAKAVQQLGASLVHAGKFAQSLPIFEKSMNIHSVLELPGEPHILSIALGFALMHLGRYKEALTHERHALSIHGKFDHSYAFKDLGRLALVEGDYAKAEEYLQKATALFQAKGGDANGLGQTLGCLGFLALRLDNLQQAYEYIHENLEIAANTQVYLPNLTALAGVALLHAAKGNHTVAVEIYTVALQNRHVANSRWFHDVVGQQIDAVAATLSPDVVAAAQARGRAQDWRSTVPQLLLAWDELFPQTRHLTTRPK